MEHNYLKISDIGKVITGKTPSTEDANNFDGKYPFITPSDIKTYSEKYLLDTERTLSDLGADTLNGNILPKNTICFVCIGSTIGKMCMTNCESFTNQQINSLIPFPEYDSSFIFYMLRYVKSYFQSIGGGTGSGKGIVNKTVFSKTKLDIPFNLETQKRIAEILSAYDSLIELNTKRIKTLEQMAENLYKEWFVRFRFPGHENAEFENGIPKGWEYKKLSELIDVRYGKDHKDIEDGDIPVFGSGGIMRYGDKQLYLGETVLIPRKGTLNNIMYYSGPFWTVDTMFYSVPLIENFAKYAYYTLSKFDMESFNSGAALPSMTTNILYHLKMLVPDENTLKAFDSFVSTLFIKKESLLKENDNLIKQRDLLLPRLMSGKLEV